MRAAGARVVIVMAHMCVTDSRRVAAAVNGIDAIVGDHCGERVAEPEHPGVSARGPDRAADLVGKGLEGEGVVRGGEGAGDRFAWACGGAGVLEDGEGLLKAPCQQRGCTQVPHAAGIAYASKLRGEDRVVGCWVGEGATSEGDTNEAFNFAWGDITGRKAARVGFSLDGVRWKSFCRTAETVGLPILSLIRSAFATRLNVTREELAIDQTDDEPGNVVSFARNQTQDHAP